MHVFVWIAAVENDFVLSVFDPLESAVRWLSDIIKYFDGDFVTDVLKKQ